MSVIEVKVQVRAKESELIDQADGTFMARLKSPPVDGKANAELIGLVAEHYGVLKSAVAIKTGASARIKRLVIDTAKALDL